MPAVAVALVTARNMASVRASAAMAPIAPWETWVSSVPVDSANTVSPSPGPHAGLIVRASPAEAIWAILAVSVLVKRALVATVAMVVCVPGGGGSTLKPARMRSMTEKSVFRLYPANH